MGIKLAEGIEKLRKRIQRDQERLDPEKRGQDELQKFCQAMSHELRANAHKGSWEEMKGDADAMVYEVFYHALKLSLAIKLGMGEAAILEFAADTGNSAMFVADNYGVLDDQDPQRDPTVFSPDNPHAGRLYQNRTDLLAFLKEIDLISKDREAATPSDIAAGGRLTHATVAP